MADDNVLRPEQDAARSGALAGGMSAEPLTEKEERAARNKTKFSIPRWGMREVGERTWIDSFVDRIWATLDRERAITHEYQREARERMEMSASLLARAEKAEAALDEEIGERDYAEDALTETHRALGGDGEWVSKIPEPPPPDSGDLFRDTPVLAERVAASLSAAVAERDAVATAAFRLLVSCLRADANEELTGEVDGSDMQGVRDVLADCPDCAGHGSRDKLPHEDEVLEDDNICPRCEGWGILPEARRLRAAAEGR